MVISWPLLILFLELECRDLNHCHTKIPYLCQVWYNGQKIWGKTFNLYSVDNFHCQKMQQYTMFFCCRSFSYFYKTKALFI